MQRTLLVGLLVATLVILGGIVAYSPEVGIPAAIGIVLLGLLIHRLEVGVFMLLFFSVLLPVGIILPGLTTWLYFPQLFLPFLLGLVALSFLGGQKPVLAPPLLPMSLLLLVVLISGSQALQSGTYFNRMDIFYGAYLIFAPTATYFATTNAIRDPHWRKSILLTVLVLGGLEASLAVASIVGDQVLSLFESKGPLLYSTLQGGFAGAFLSMVVALAWARLLHQGSSLLEKVALGILLGVLLLGQLAIYSRSAWVATLVAMATVTFLLRPRLVWGVVVAGVVAASTVVQVAGPEIPDRLLEIFYYRYPNQVEESLARLHLTEDALEIMGQSPLLGVGPGNYLYWARYTFRGQLISSAHNNYAQIAAEIGVLGLAAFLWVLFALAREGYQLYRRGRDGEAKVLGAAFLGSLAGLAIMSLGGDFLINSHSNAGLHYFRATLLFWVLGGAVSASLRQATWTAQPEKVPAPLRPAVVEGGIR